MELLGVTLSTVPPNEVLKSVEEYIDSNELHHIVTVNPEYIVEAQKNVEFRHVLNSADIQTIDGIGVVLALEYIKKRGAKKDSLFLGFVRFALIYIQNIFFGRDRSYGKLAGVDLIWLLIQQNFMRGRKVYLLGGRDNVAAAAAKRLSQFSENIQFRTSNGLSDVRNPDSAEEQRVLSDIRQFQPDVLLVAYGHPWQDLWIARNKNKLGCRVAIGVGGSFDYIAGRVTRAPVWMRGVGLEWLYRLVRQPARYVRIFRATFVFMRMVISS